MLRLLGRHVPTWVPLHMNATNIIHIFVLLVLLPAWLLLGLADWFCHRKARVEVTSGPRESAIHILLSTLAAVAILPGLFLEINATVLLVMAGAFIAHEVATTWDVRLAVQSRAFTVREQRIHDYLTAVPVLALGLILATHIDQAAALLGLGDVRADFHVRFKNPPLPTEYLVSWIGATVVLNQIPFAEELWRGIRARRISEDVERIRN
jgi:hypothetical protein